MPLTRVTPGDVQGLRHVRPALVKGVKFSADVAGGGDGLLLVQDVDQLQECTKNASPGSMGDVRALARQKTRNSI